MSLLNTDCSVLDKVLVVSKYNWDTWTEIFDLSSTSSSCNIATYPGSAVDYGTLFEGKPFVCGEKTDFSGEEGCFWYNNENNTWTRVTYQKIKYCRNIIKYSTT